MMAIGAAQSAAFARKQRVVAEHVRQKRHFTEACLGFINNPRALCSCCQKLRDRVTISAVRPAPARIPVLAWIAPWTAQGCFSIQDTNSRGAPWELVAGMCHLA